jgi:hypothetical protein
MRTCARWPWSTDRTLSRAALPVIKQSGTPSSWPPIGVEQQRLTIGAPTGQPCIHDGTGIVEPATAVSQCADTRGPCARRLWRALPMQTPVELVESHVVTRVEPNGPPRAARRSLRSMLPALPRDRVGDFSHPGFGRLSVTAGRGERSRGRPTIAWLRLSDSGHVKPLSEHPHGGSSRRKGAARSVTCSHAGSRSRAPEPVKLRSVEQGEAIRESARAQLQPMVFAHADAMKS